MSLIIAGVVLVVALYVVDGIYRKNMNIWLPAYFSDRHRSKPKPRAGEPVHVVFCCVDHFEPLWAKASLSDQLRRLDFWCTKYPKLADKHKDSNGRPVQHTFFYPEEEYREDYMEKLAGLCKAGYGDVEIHLHHDNDTADGLRNKIESFKEKLQKHGLLSRDEKGKITYGFIHGNWALDNSRRDGRWCGINNELQVLRETGCYADFTLPSAPSDTQTRKINSIYYATDDPDKPKSHDNGVDVEVGKEPVGDLMIVQGPLALDWKNRKYGLFPRTENGEISAHHPPSPRRVDTWVRQHIHVKGEPNWVFVKVHTHGCQEKNFHFLLDEPMDEMLTYLEKNYNDGARYQLHYLTARETYAAINKLVNSTK